MIKLNEWELGLVGVPMGNAYGKAEVYDLI